MKLTLKRRQILWAYAFLSVSLVFFVVIRWYPTVLAFNISFRDWNIFQNSGPWIGLENYQDIWEDLFKQRSPVRAAFLNTIQYVIIGVPVQMALGLMIALMLNSDRTWGCLLPRGLLHPLRDLTCGRRLCVELAIRTTVGPD